MNKHYVDRFIGHLSYLFSGMASHNISPFIHSEQGIILAFLKALYSECDDPMLNDFKQNLIDLVRENGEGCIIHGIALDILPCFSFCCLYHRIECF